MVKKKIYFTDEKYLHFEAKLNSYDLEVSINYNERIRLLFQNIIEPSLSWFSTEIIGTNANVAINIKTLNDNCVLPITMNSLLVHFNKVRNELSHADPQILGKEEFDYFNVQTRKFIKYFKPEGLKENRNPISEAEKDFEIVEIDILDSNDPRYLGKYGHYKINNEEFISIYGFKNKFGLSGNDKNGNEALQILEQGIKSYKSVPEIGKFRVVRVFPLLFLQGFYKSEKTNKMKALIDEEYYSLINGLDAIRTLIIGQDPYPFGAMGIAFCTNDFPSLKNNNCCGFDVLKSLGIDLDGLKKHYNNPKELFTELAIEQGIIFINIAYEKLGSDEMANIKIIDEAFKINKPILEKVKQGNIVAAGTKCQQFLITKYNVRNFLAVIHPSKLNRDSENQTLRMKWKQHWDPNRLKVLLKL